MEPTLTIEGAPPALLTTFEGAAFGLLLLGLPIFGLELVRLSRQGELTRARVRGMLTSAFCLVPSVATEALVAGAVGAIYVGVASLTPLSIPTTWATALLCLLLVDFGYYWEHRWSHEMNVFWASFHATHHSANHYDQSIGLRISFTEHVLNWPVIAVHLSLVLVGFHPVLVVASYGLMLAWQQWIHTETVGRLPWLDGWLNTPSNHRVHHGRNPEYLDRNYGGILMVWDRLFGTYAPETVPVDYGLVHRLESPHPAQVHFSVWTELGPRLARAQTWREAWRLLIGPPSQLDEDQGRSNPRRSDATAA